ncbi:MAG: iron-containing alcohol dehydrogenase [Opitutales bacterium]
MDNFTFANPTRLHFGRGQIEQIAREVPADARVLLVAGGGSLRKNGVYDAVKSALGERTLVEFWGVEANPDYDTVMKAVEMGRAEEVDFILAVGGGSVLDGAKFIAAAIPFEGDPWRILETTGSVVERAVPLAAVLTLPATGSEMNGTSVISRRAIGEKLHFISPHVYPVFSILDPETTFSLPARQVANGITDAFVHIIEQYLTYPVHGAVQDQWSESLLRVLIEVGPQTLERPTDYDLRANLCWAATCALNGIIGVGVPQDWATHAIGHELTALYGIDHAQTLAIILPPLLEAQRGTKGAKLLQYAERVWGLTEGSDAERIDAAIAKTRAFFESLGIATYLREHTDATDTAAVVRERFARRGAPAFGEHGDLTLERIEAILQAAA